MIPSGNHVGFIKLFLEQLNKKRLNNRFSAIGCQTPIAEFFYVYDSNGNIVRATEVDIELSGGKTMSAFG